MKKIKKIWNSLPKFVKVIPYIALSGALTAVIKYLSEIQFNDALLLGFINIIIVLLKETRDNIK